MEPTSTTNLGPATNQSLLPGDVAVVGLSCRLAGGIENPEDFWTALLEKQVKSGPIPPMRWEAYRHRDARNPKAYSYFPMTQLLANLI
jgi:6-methylsalicylic acid synthase